MLVGYSKGDIRWKGQDIDKKNVYGIELGVNAINGTDGTHNGKRYFYCGKERGIFVHRGSILGKMTRQED